MSRPFSSGTQAAAFEDYCCCDCRHYRQVEPETWDCRKGILQRVFAEEPTPELVGNCLDGLRCTQWKRRGTGRRAPGHRPKKGQIALLTWW